MLPSFRPVVAAFFCGFVVVSAALHLFASARLAQESSPQLATGVAALPLGGGSANDWRLDAPAPPVMFDPRFAIDATTTAPAPAGLTLHAIHRATGALPKTEPEKVALLPDRDSPASVMLPVPAVPASAVAPPASAPRVPEQAGVGPWTAAIGPNPFEQPFQEPPMMAPASKAPAIATTDIPARDVEPTIKTPVDSTPAGQAVPERELGQDIDVKQHMMGPALVPSTVAQENSVKPLRVDPAIEQQSLLEADGEAPAAKHAPVGPAEVADAAIRPKFVEPVASQAVRIDPVIAEQAPAPIAAAEQEPAEPRASQSVVDRPERPVQQVTPGVAAKPPTDTPTAFEDAPAKQVADEQLTAQKAAVQQEIDTTPVVENAAPEQETVEQPDMQEAAVDQVRNPPAAINKTTVTQEAEQPVVADDAANNETVAQPDAPPVADQVVEQEAPQRVASITPDPPPPVARERSTVAATAPTAPVAALAPHAPLGEDLPAAAADDVTTPDTADQPIEPAGPGQRPAAPVEPEADASSEFTAKLITLPKLPKAKPAVRTVRATPAVRAKPTHRAKPAIQVRRKMATKRVRPIRPYRREATTDPFVSPFQGNWPQ